ncbi:PREDICTED: odorant receptor 63a-like isoform X2 [Vollenhovia emeryi]|uniref:odorant receptor 63a-like isoform X2 n=1 Tax=Vollenhovia emeryi TaxID=411798 RepID=UPI0005F37BAD|nr:PREDICTED: odorant receptor 63a-like isoform X2 [Vollenhovia emeryi]
MHELHVTEKVNPVATLCDLKKDLQLSIQLNRWILKPLGAWPKSNQISSIERYAYALINVICTSLIGFLFVPSAIYLVLEMDDAYNILKLTGPLNFCLMAVVKYSSLIFREDDIRSGIEHIASDWTNTQHYDDRIIMIRNAKFGRRLVTICAFFMYGGATFYYLALPFNNGKITEDGGNLTYRPLMYPVARVIVDARHSPISEIFFWTQCLSGFIVHSITTGACSLAAVFAMHAYGRLEVLMQWIEHLVDGREDFCNNIDERLKMIVQQHVRVLHFISLTDKILREISVVEIVGCTLSMCLLGYYLIMEWESKEMTSYVTYIVLYISLTFNIFILCYIGELVGEKCKEIGEVSYMIDWHRLSGRKGLNLILMIAMSNTSIKLTAGNLFELSLSTFGDVVRTSVAYLNMLRTLTT